MNNKVRRSITVDDLFCRDFMKKHTGCDSFPAFLEMGFGTKDMEGFDAIPDAAFDRYVAESTDFENWEQML